MSKDPPIISVSTKPFNSVASVERNLVLARVEKQKDKDNKKIRNLVLFP